MGAYGGNIEVVVISEICHVYVNVWFVCESQITQAPTVTSAELVT
jgi:hypothetical protein